MRQIKFRVWDGVDYMSNPFTLSDLQNGTIQFASNVEVMQFTGLLDKNGKEIYEGDILDCGQAIEVVRFQGAYILPLSWISDVVVIGNIYENPELIKQQTATT